MKYKVIENIQKYLCDNDILRNCETYEEIPVIERYKELECIEKVIKKDDYTSFMTNIAIMYTNVGLIYAKSQLSKEEFDKYAIFWGLEYSKEVISDIGFIVPSIFFTRKANVLLEYLNNPIDIKHTKVYDYIKNLIGINEFLCYLGESEEDEFQQYFFIHPNQVCKILNYQRV